MLEKCLRSPGLAGQGEGEGRGRKKGTGLPQTEKKTQAGKRKIKRHREWPDVNLTVSLLSTSSGLEPEPAAH